MPQSARKDPISQRAQDKESKRARGALSCAECRRLKLKCDKTVPCSSCKRRGCSAICPNGSLITGQGTRFVLADTEKLHQKIGFMSDRIRQLEDALAILQSTITSDPHPLLHRDLLKIKSSIELHSAVEGEDGDPVQEEQEESQYIDSFGTLAIRDDGAATFYGRSAGSESLLIGEVATSQSDMGSPPDPNGSDWQPDLPLSITELASSFPIPSSAHYAGIDIDYIVQSFLPSWQEACRLCELYLEQAPWFFGAVTQRQLHEEILPLWYQEAVAPSTPLSQSTSDAGLSMPTPSKGGAHELALMFVIFCFGALTDIALRSAPENSDASQYYQLTKAALALEPVLDRPPSVATVQVLSLMAIYEGIASGENSIESTWALMGLATKLAQSIGLHRDCARWKLSPAEVQKRRALFWELFITDCWQSLATGRLATFSLPFIDCELPYDPNQTISDDGTVQPSFPFWKARFGAECVSAVVQGTLTSRAPKYSIILELDRKVRDMKLPLYAQGPPPQGLGLAQTMSHFMPTNYRELTLLYIHRCFFAHAISSHPRDPVKSQYAPSFLAGYRSACTIIGSVKLQFSLFPAQIARFWVLWTHAFSAAVMLSSVVIHSSQSKVAPAALLELRTACDLFEKAATYGGRAGKFLPILQRLQAKGQQIYLQSNSGIPPSLSNDIFQPSSKKEQNDELSIFSGKTHTLTTKASTPPTRASHSQGSNGGSSRASSDSPQQGFVNNPLLAGAHPSLISEMHGFDGHINAQIRNVRHVDDDMAIQSTLDMAQQQQYHRQQLERQELERRELERQEAQRQQLERQQRLERQQYDEQRHQQLLQKQQQHMQHHEQQVHLQNHQQYRQHHEPQPTFSDHYPVEIQIHGVPAPAPAPALNYTYDSTLPDAQPQQSHTLQHSSYPRSQYQTPQHEMYRIPPDSRHRSIDTKGSSSAQYTPPVTTYDPQTHVPSNNNQYWTAAPSTYAPEHRFSSSSSSQVYQPQQPLYTPEAALKGIAAEDRSLQETWQSYMYKVGSPRHMFDD